jgi:ubiquinone biosynthesis protein UbiJ
VDRFLTRAVEVMVQIPDRMNKNGYVCNWIEKQMHETHEKYMLRRIREEEEATIRSLASSDTPSAIPEVNDIRQMLERIEKKIDKLIEKGG